ncbi:MAG: hypothetical protein HQK73_05625 [Desulfamplus sp.]|nr:hypothetical protein [Desulfamplus sp.]
MNVNSYSSYSNSLLNPYSPVSSSQAVNGTQRQSNPLSQDTLKEVSPLQSSGAASGNDFSVNISQEAREQNNLSTTQPLNASISSEASYSVQETASTSVQQAQESQMAKNVQQNQQIQSQFYQSPYGQIPLSRSNIDLMA